jgi:large subunit ribosomal protein L19
MQQAKVIDELEGAIMKKDLPEFKVGDTISVSYRIIEGEKERTQVFTGVVIARKGHGISETFSMYRVAYGSAMERVFPIHSPRVAKIEVEKSGKVRRGKLYHLRGLSGKKAKIKERLMKQVGPEIFQAAETSTAE